jgi:hypothetical protein
MNNHWSCQHSKTAVGNALARPDASTDWGPELAIVLLLYFRRTVAP